MNKAGIFQLKNITSKIGSGATPKGGQDSYKNYGISLIRSQNVLDFHFSSNGLVFIDEKQANKLSNVEVKESDILLNITGDSIARCCIVPNEILPARVNQHVSIIRCKNSIESKYVFFYLQYLKSYLLTICKVGGTRNALTKESIEKLQIQFHKNSIFSAELLSSLNAKIELNNRINRELEQMAKLLYDYWFVQFDFPDINEKPYKSSGGKMVWNKELKREIPEGWEVEKLTKRISENKSGDWGSETLHGNYTKKVNCIRGADLNGFNGLEQSNPPVRFIHKDNTFKILSEGDVVIEISGGSPTQSTGRLSFITEASMKRFENPLICSNFCKPITLKNPELVYIFVYEWNKLYDNNVFFNYEGKTSGIKNLLFDVFAKSYKTVIPEESIVKKFNKIVESIHKKKHANLTENHRLTALRDWLLPMLMNGQVRVGEAGKKEYLLNEGEMSVAAEPGGEMD